MKIKINDKGKDILKILLIVYLLTISGLNVYIPKKDGTTTEIDIIMVDETGIYVFELKNYSGWIFRA